MHQQMSSKYGNTCLVDRQQVCSCAVVKKVQQSETAVTEAAVVAGGRQKSWTAVLAKRCSRTRQQ